MINEKQFTELYTDITKKAAKIPQECYLGEGNYPIVDQGKGQIAGRWNEVEGLCIEIPAIIFGDHTRAIKYIDDPFFIGADGVRVLRPTNKADNPKYYYYALQAARIPNLGYSRHFKVVKELMIRVYPRADQDKIVSILEKIDEVIEIRQAELSALEQLVKSRFIELFGDPIANTNKKKLSEAGKIFTGSTPSMKEPSYYESHDIPFIKPSDLKEVGVTSIEGVEAYISEKARHVARVIPPNSVLVTCIGTIGKVGIATRESTCNQQINFIVPSENVNPVYLAYCLTFFKSILLTMANAPVVPIINKTQFSELEVPVFGIELQNQFAAFVEQVDKSKFNIQQSIDKLETLKKSLMQQYFG